jgi:mono/diheme cytochrome c family protein
MAMRLAAALLLAVLGSGAAAWAQDDPELVERGRRLVERNCAQCHAVGEDDASALPAAPPFRTLKEQYPIEDLAEPLAEGISAGHAQMPERAFAPEDVDAILAYLGTL